MFRGRDDELQSEDEDERSAADGGEEPEDEDDVTESARARSYYSN